MQTAWVITREGTRHPTEVLGILSARKSATKIKEHIEWLYALLHCGPIAHLEMAKYNNPDNTCKAENTRTNTGIPVSTTIRCGHNPYLAATLARNVVLYQVSEILTQRLRIPKSSLCLIQHGERRRFAMSVPIPLRGDFASAWLRGLAKKTKSAPQARRLLAVAAIYDGATRTEAAKIGGVGLQIIRDWVLRFNARGPNGLLDGKSPGQPPKLNDAQRRVVAQMIESGPIPAIHGVVRWRLIDLAQWIFEEFRITIAKADAQPRVARHGATADCRPDHVHHAQAEGAIEAFKKLPHAPG